MPWYSQIHLAHLAVALFKGNKGGVVRRHEKIGFPMWKF
jgi:hypothetical protein